jgi:hypothetical protein
MEWEVLGSRLVNALFATLFSKMFKPVGYIPDVTKDDVKMYFKLQIILFDNSTNKAKSCLNKA